MSFTTAPETPVHMLWHAKTILWILIYGEALALLLALSPASVAESKWLSMFFFSIIIQWILLTTLATLYLLRHWLKQLATVHVAHLSVSLLLLSTLLSSQIVWHFFPALATSQGGHSTATLQALLIALTTGCLGLVTLYNHWRLQQLSLRTKQAELDALRARVDPHFLFNSLNTAVALVHTQPDEAEQVLLDLSDLFRAALSGNDLHLLKREIELTRSYLKIENLRLGERLRVDWNQPETLPHRQIPALTLQTLVENAVRHGIEKMPGGGTIKVQVSQDGRALRLRVSNAIPLRPAKPSPTGHQVGIAATKARVEAITGGEGGLLTFIENGQYVSEIVLPHRAHYPE
ncbi:histidine kinase [Lysobacteraceae bacterium NML07-0707]|nr:histidine kinase [Xanthomonadaceae bacterium NML07-0707]